MNRLNSLIVLATCFFSTAGIIAQNLNDTIYFNSYQERVELPDSNGFYRTITFDTEGSFQFIVNDFYMNGQLKMSGSYRSLNPDKMNGKFNYYYPNGRLYKQCNYNNNLLNGKFQLWYENGQLKQECFYVNNKLTGTYKSWAQNGILTKQAEYKDGKKDGRLITYYQNSNPARIEKYEDDILMKARCFTASGKDTSYFIYFTPPSFLGGDVSAFTKWVMEKLQYPYEAINKMEEGEVNVKFTVSNDGSIKGIQITKQDRSYFNSEVLRVISSSPLWKPALRDTDSVEVSIEIPIKFTLPEINK